MTSYCCEIHMWVCLNVKLIFVHTANKGCRWDRLQGVPRALPSFHSDISCMWLPSADHQPGMTPSLWSALWLLPGYVDQLSVNSTFIKFFLVKFFWMNLVSYQCSSDIPVLHPVALSSRKPSNLITDRRNYVSMSYYIHTIISVHLPVIGGKRRQKLLSVV